MDLRSPRGPGLPGLRSRTSRRSRSRADRPWTLCPCRTLGAENLVSPVPLSPIPRPRGPKGPLRDLRSPRGPGLPGLRSRTSRRPRSRADQPWTLRPCRTLGAENLVSPAPTESHPESQGAQGSPQGPEAPAWPRTPGTSEPNLPETSVPSRSAMDPAPLQDPRRGEPGVPGPTESHPETQGAQGSPHGPEVSAWSLTPGTSEPNLPETSVPSRLAVDPAPLQDPRRGELGVPGPTESHPETQGAQGSPHGPEVSAWSLTPGTSEPNLPETSVPSRSAVDLAPLQDPRRGEPGDLGPTESHPEAQGAQGSPPGSEAPAWPRTPGTSEPNLPETSVPSRSAVDLAPLQDPRRGGTW